MKKRSTITIVILLLVLAAQSAWAIPAFARRYKISCTTCHTPFPKLKPYGAEFAGNGFILKEEEKARDYVSAGDPLLWLNKDFPVAVRFDAFGVVEPDQKVDTDLQIPWGLKLLSGGTLYKNIGYYFYFYMSERGEVAGVEDAYVHFDNIGGSALDLMVGQFQTSDPLMKRELRLTFEDYLIYKAKPGLSRADLTYDRGIMALYGIAKTGTDLVGFIVNGNGKRIADEETKKFDDDGFKNVGFRLLQSIGPYVSVGGFVYKGQERMLEGAAKNEISYWGPDFNLWAGPIELTVQYLKRTDSDPLFDGAGEVETKGMVAELIVSPKLDQSRFFLTGLYNKVESDLPELDYETATLSGTYLVARNLRLSLEVTRDLIRDANRLVIGTVTGF